jgi:hypothetical protein
MHRAAIPPLLCLILAACGLQPSIATPSPSPTPTPEASQAPTPTASPLPTATPAPTPGYADVPRFPTGAPVLTNAPGLRVRSRPGTQQRVIATLGVDARLVVGMGPVFLEGMGWYLVHDDDEADPSFSQGWVASGFEPEPFLIGSSAGAGFDGYLGGFAGDVAGEYGPVLLPAGADVSLLWIAAPLGPSGCSFAVDLRAGSGEPVPAVRTTVGGYAAPGELYDQFFTEHPELTGDIFVSITSTCSWALAFVENLPAASESPAPS